jgi:lambda family phage portal protein
VTDQFRVSRWDRFLIGLAPHWGLRRVRARAAAQLMARHYEAASGGRRTSGWHRSSSDANAAAGPALATLREHSRDLKRNNGWAKRGLEAIANNTVGWGIVPRPDEKSPFKARKGLDLWNAWADSPACDFDGRMSFYGLQRLVMETVAESGEALVLRQPAGSRDNLPIPLRLQVLEPDHLDTSRDGVITDGGGKIIHGVEFDALGRRVAYWLFRRHPGSQVITDRFKSERISADNVLHIYRVERPGQIRGVPWLATAIVKLKDLDDYEDAVLMQQKIAACFSVFVADIEGNPEPLGETDPKKPDRIESLEPGHIEYLTAGRDVKFATPPSVNDASFTIRTLRGIAAGLGVTYEDLTGDMSQVNFSSARMGRLAHWANVHNWRWNMIIPQLCNGVWRWVMELARALHGWADFPVAKWGAPAMPMIEPDREGLAYQRLMRAGVMSLYEVIAERGEDPIAHLDEIERANKELDARGIILDSDARRTAASGQQQLAAGAKSAPGDDLTQADDGVNK